MASSYMFGTIYCNHNLRCLFYTNKIIDVAATPSFILKNNEEFVSFDIIVSWYFNDYILVPLWGILNKHKVTEKLQGFNPIGLGASLYNYGTNNLSKATKYLQNL